METEIRIVAASYRRTDVAIELFGRTRDNRSVTVLYRGFLPHIDLIDPDPNYIRHLKAEGEYVSEEEKRIWYEGDFRQALRVTLRSPWKAPT